MVDMFIGSSNSSNMNTSAMSPSETVFWSSISMSKDLPPQLFKECDLILRLHRLVKIHFNSTRIMIVVVLALLSSLTRVLTANGNDNPTPL